MKPPEAPDYQRARDLKAAAFTWQAEGISVVPVMPRSKDCITTGWGSRIEKPTTTEEILKWFSFGKNNMAVVCGSGRLVVLDFDSRLCFEAWQRAVGAIAETYTETTGRGVHQFYKVTGQPITKVFSGCEVLGIGHLCNVAPSIHPDGSIYTSPDPLAPILEADQEKLFSLLSFLFPPREVHPVHAQKAIFIPGPIVKRDDTAGRIKAAYPIVQAVRDAGVTIMHASKDGRYLVARCPFHDDKRASMWIDQVLNLWGCYSPHCEANRHRPATYTPQGKEKRAQDVINFYALWKRIPLEQAITELSKAVTQ